MGPGIRFAQREKGRLLRPPSPAWGPPALAQGRTSGHQTGRGWALPVPSSAFLKAGRKSNPLSTSALTHESPPGRREEATVHGQLLLAAVWRGHNCPPRVRGSLSSLKNDQSLVCQLSQDMFQLHKPSCQTKCLGPESVRSLTKLDRFVYVVLTQ